MKMIQVEDQFHDAIDQKDFQRCMDILPNIIQNNTLNIIRKNRSVNPNTIPYIILARKNTFLGILLLNNSDQMNGNVIEIAKLLIRNGAIVHKIEIEQGLRFYPICFMAEKNMYELLKYSIEHGTNTNLNIQNEEKKTPLHFAAEGGHYRICELLLNHRASVEIIDIRIATPLHLAAVGGHDRICELLLNHDANANIQDADGKTPLHMAAAGGHNRICALLLNHDANANIQDADGKTPLHMAAAAGGHFNVYELLLGHGSDATIQDLHNITHLRIAAEGRYYRICELLLNHHANHTIQDANDRTPLHIAAQCGHDMICELLINRNNANPTIQHLIAFRVLTFLFGSLVITLILIYIIWQQQHLDDISMCINCY